MFGFRKERSTATQPDYATRRGLLPDLQRLWNKERDEPSDGLAIGAIIQLPPLERFVFVMSVLERYSDRECAVLLSCAAEEVREARACALQHYRAARAITISAAAPPSRETQRAHLVMMDQS